MSPQSIVKTMKYGLLSLTPEELKLMRNLAAAGLLEDQCRSVVTCGLLSQNECILHRLLSSRIDVPGILTWPRRIAPATPMIISFLRKLGVNEDTLCYVEENGVDDEAEDMPIDLVYNEYEEIMASEEVIRECSLPTVSSCSTFLEETTANIASDSSSFGTRILCPTFLKIRSNLVASTCICRLIKSVKLLRQKQDDNTSHDYLRQTVTVPLTWAITRALRYQPSDFIHYIAHQLLRWKYVNVSQKEVRDIQEFVASATMMTKQRRTKLHESIM